jgi:hypothetical protein
MKLLSKVYFRWFIAGFAFGFLLSVIYLIIEGPPFLFVPMWAQIAGYPGIQLGWWFYDHLYNHHNFPAEAFGCVINGFAYGILFLLSSLLIQMIRKNDTTKK